jgi:hypothetical protein
MGQAIAYRLEILLKLRERLNKSLLEQASLASLICLFKRLAQPRQLLHELI